MKTSENSPLLTELTIFEEANLSGGNPFMVVIVGAGGGAGSGGAANNGGSSTSRIDFNFFFNSIVGAGGGAGSGGAAANGGSSTSGTATAGDGVDIFSQGIASLIPAV